ncbi:MAG TPA: hypothetical protein VF063_07625, partial [Gaiellaceae bacterium]
SDRLLNEDAFEAAARTFMTAVEAKTRSIFEAAETQWKTPNRCVDMKSDVPAELVPGQSVNVHVSATSKRGDPAANLRSYAHYVPYKSAGLTVDPFAPASPDENMASDFKVTPPSQPWPDSSPERLRIILFSTGGIGEIDTDFKAQTLPFRYRVLHAAYSVKSSGSMPGGLCASFGGTSGTTALTGESSGDPLEDPANKIDGIGGALFGQIYGQVRDGITQVLQGCELNSQAQKIPCSMSGSSQLPNTRATGFNIAVPDPKSGTATVHWLILSPGIGGPTLPCDVMIWAPVPYDKSTVTVPMSTFLSKEPQTLTFSDSMHSDQDGLGKPASIDYTWSYSVTFQRI